MEEDVGVPGREFEGVNDLHTLISTHRGSGQDRANRESNLSMSAWEYEAPKTAFGSEAFDEAILPFVGRFCQKGDVFLLQRLSIRRRTENAI